jgi:hypothetical protein
MRIVWIVTLTILCSARGIALADSPSASQPQDVAAQQAAQMPADATVDQVLDAMDARGRNLTDFSARVKLTNSDATTGDSVVNDGTVQFQKKPDGDVRIRVAFDKQQNGDEIEDVDHSYVLDGGWLIERDAKAKKEIRRQVKKPGEKIDPFKLGEGPFPLPIGQKKGDVKKLFTVTLVPPAKDDPANTTHLLLVPIAGTDYDGKFKTIDLWVDRTSAMPVRIKTIDSTETTVKQTDLSDVKTNSGINDDVFKIGPLPEGWDQLIEPYGQQ